MVFKTPRKNTKVGKSINLPISISKRLNHCQIPIPNIYKHKAKKAFTEEKNRQKSKIQICYL